MRIEDLEVALTRDPFVPLRLHLVNGQTVDIPGSRVAWLMPSTAPNALLVFRNLRPGTHQADGYDVIALKKIERFEEVADGGHERKTA